MRGGGKCPTCGKSVRVVETDSGETIQLDDGRHTDIGSERFWREGKFGLYRQTAEGESGQRNHSVSCGQGSLL